MEYSLSFEVHWKEYYYMILEQMRRRFFIICWIVGIFLLFTGITSITAAERPLANFVGSLVFAAFGFVDAFCLFVLPRYVIGRMNFKYEKMYVGTQHATVNEEGLAATYEFGGVLLHWPQLGKIKEGRYNFYFYTSKKQWTFIPKADMKKEDIPYLREIIRNYVDSYTEVRLRKS